MRHPRRYAIRVLAEVQEVSAKGARSYRRPAFVPTRGQDGIERPQQRNLGGVPGRPVVAASGHSRRGSILFCCRACVTAYLHYDSELGR